MTLYSNQRLSVWVDKGYFKSFKCRLKNNNFKKITLLLGDIILKQALKQNPT